MVLLYYVIIAILIASLTVLTYWLVTKKNNSSSSESFLSATSCPPGFAGPNCQYGDATTCKGLGMALPNGNCNYDCSKVYPRCATCTDYDNQPDLSKITCTSTVNPLGGAEIFDTARCAKMDPSNPSNPYGCPIKKDVGAWHKYVGSACHIPDGDINNCIEPVSRVCRVNPDVNHKADYCYSPDFTIKPASGPNYFKDIDTTGLSSDRHVVGFASAWDDMFQRQQFYYPSGEPVTPYKVHDVDCAGGEVNANNDAWDAGTNYWNDVNCVI
jgi:hypothetical protein